MGPEIKKLITAFLMLATITSSGVLIFSNFKETFSSRSEPASKTSEEPLGVVPDQNAFVEPIPETPLAQFGDSSLSREEPPPPVEPSSNLTETLARHLARQVIIANPEGPRNTDGARAILTPDQDALNSIFSESIFGSQYKELGITVSEENLVIIPNPIIKDNDSYIQGVSKILSETTVSARYRALTASEPTAEAIALAERIYARATYELERLPVPFPLVNLHKSLLVSLKEQQKIFEIAANYTEDPLKTLIVLPDSARIIDQGFKNFEDEFRKVNFIKQTGRAPAENKIISFLKTILPINKARAQAVPINVFSTTDPETLGFHAAETANSAGTWAENIWKNLRVILTETLKNQIVHRFVQQIIEWVKGNGKPQFITNWQGFLDDTVNETAGYFIQQLYPPLCSPFKDLIRLALVPIPSLAPSRTACTLDRVVSNVRNFYNNFQEGGWIGYTTLLKPSNNFFGSIIQVSDIVAFESEKAKESAKAEAETGQGFLSTKTCIDEDPATGKCKPGGYITTTPGGQVAHITSKALADSPIDQVVNAADLEALISAVIDSFLNKVILSGAAGITGTSEKRTTSSGVRTQPQSICDDLRDDPVEFEACLDDIGLRNRNLGRPTDTPQRLRPSSPPPPSGGTPPPQTTTDTQAPTPPSNLIASLKPTGPSTTGVQLTWIAATDNVGVVKYRISRSTVNNGPYAVLDETAGGVTTYVDANVVSRTSYYYVIRAIDAAGNESPDSSQDVATLP